MKSGHLIIAIALTLFGLDCFAALPICAKNCDEHWNACLKSCAKGLDGLKCRNTCAEQHESCLNTCKSGASIDSKYKYSFLSDRSDFVNPQAETRFAVSIR